MAIFGFFGKATKVAPAICKIERTDTMRFKYCPDCGSRLSSKDLGDEKDVPWCEACSKPWFEMFPCCIIAIAHRDGSYALIRQQSCDEIKDDKFICVSGYIKTNETAQQAAVREVKEELGLDALSCQLISTYPYEKKQMLMIGFSVEVGEGGFTLSDELVEARWFDENEAREKLKNTSVGNLLFDDIIRRNKNGRN